MRLTRTLTSAAAVMVASLAFVSAAAAQGDSRPKDRACVLDCREVYSRCSDAAYAEARMCMQECAEAIAAARTICEESPDSEECAEARRRAAACVRECRATLRQDLRICRADAKECVGLCPDAAPMVPADPLCLRECRRQTSACLDRANAAARECAEPCADLVAKAKEVCAGAPRSDECAKARREASACLQPCREQLASHTRQCVANGKRCAASCPPVVDTPAASRR